MVASTTWTYASTQWRWRIGDGLAEVDALADEWNALARKTMTSPTGNAIWAACAWRAFGSSQQTLRIHSLRDERGSLLAVLPLVRTGRVSSRWQAVPDSRHTPCWDFAFDESREGASRAMVERLLESTARVDLYKVPTAGAAFDALTAGTKKAGGRIWQSAADKDAVLELAGSWPSFRSSLSKNLVSNTERKARRLERAGQLRHHTITNEEGLEAVLEECFAVEAKGWKGERGTAIQNQARTLRFYTELAHASARARKLALYTLRVGHRLIAFELCLRTEGRIDLLKLSFDPDFAKYSPSFVLRYRIIREALENGESISYHMGATSEWKQRWATHTEELARLRLFSRRPSGQLAYLSGPRLAALFKKNPSLRRGGRWLREHTRARRRIKR